MRRAGCARHRLDWSQLTPQAAQIAEEVLCNHAMVSACESPVSLLGAGQPLDRAVTAISPLTRSLERAATLFRTRPLPCHHPLTGNWDGSLISTRSHWLISSRTTEANASRFSAQIAKRWEPGRASKGVMVTIGFTWSGASRLATVGNYGVIEARFGRVRRRFFRRGRSVDNSGENGLMVEKQAVRAAQVRWSTCARRTCYRGKPRGPLGAC